MIEGVRAPPWRWPPRRAPTRAVVARLRRHAVPTALAFRTSPPWRGGLSCHHDGLSQNGDVCTSTMTNGGLGMLAICDFYRSINICDPWMLAIHERLRSMHARKTWGGADSHHARRPCYRDGDNGRLFLFQPYSSFSNHTTRGAVSLHA